MPLSPAVSVPVPPLSSATPPASSSPPGATPGEESDDADPAGDAAEVSVAASDHRPLSETYLPCVRPLINSILIVKAPSCERNGPVSRVRSTYGKREQSLDETERVRIVEITNTVEQVFFLLSKPIRDSGAPAVPSTYEPVGRHMRPADPGCGAPSR